MRFAPDRAAIVTDAGTGIARAIAGRLAEAGVRLAVADLDAEVAGKAEYGRIINMGAESVRNGLYWHAIYNAAKGGVHGLTTGLAREFAGDGITVNPVAPAVTRTEAYLAHDKPELELIAKIEAEIPAGRAGTVGEVASLVEYLAPDESSYVTGQVMSVNGGSSML